jgi:large subunit ribosomal protein L24
MKIKKGDNVKVMSGKSRGKTGKVMQVLPTGRQLVIEGVAKTVKHAKTRKQGEKGQKIEFFAPIASSNVALICPKCSKPTRVGVQVGEKGKKTRICKKCKSAIE